MEQRFSFAESAGQVLVDMLLVPAVLVARHQPEDVGAEVGGD
jgi:hypothetical protein